MRHLNSSSRAAALFTLLTLCTVTGVAQAAQERQAPAAPTGLALEVNTKEGPTGHQSVPGASFGGRYRRLPSWRPAAGVPQPRTFKLMNGPEGDAVRVKVFALMDRFHEQEVLIGDYLLREGEKAVVEGMRAYGYEPMEVTVVMVRHAPSLPPAATSRVPSVVVTGVEQRQTNFPSYKVSLRNLSHRDVTYLEIHTYKDGRRSTVYWPRGEQNRPLVKAGGVGEVSVSGGGGGQSSPAGFTPSAPHSIEIVTAVFADESYEGEAQSAFKFIAGLRGQKMQLARALALLEKASEARGADERAALEDFERQAHALNRDAPAAPEGLPAGIHGVTQREYERLKIFVEGGLDQVRKELLKDVREYGQARERAPESRPYNAWLGDLRKKYEAWLSRLQPSPGGQ